MNKKNLTEFKKGNKVYISCINCGREFSRRLCDLGLFDGAELEVVKNDNFGPIIVKILNSKIALGRGEASKIYAQEI